MTREEWESLIKSTISSYDSTIDVEVGSVYDLIIRPLSGFLYELESRVSYTESLLDISKWPSWTVEDLDLVAGMYGLKRRGATKSRCIVTFYSFAVKEDISIPRGVTVSTQNGLIFYTIDELKVPYGSVEDYKNVVTGRYEFDVPVECSVEGYVGNVGARSITVLQTPVPGIAGVVNKVAAKGGAGAEDNQSFSQRLIDLMTGGYSVGSASALRLSLVSCFDRIIDSSVERDNPVLEGTIDVYWKGSDYKIATDTTYYYGFEILLKNRPVYDVLRVWSGVGVEYQRDVDWKFVKDLASAYAGTVYSKDKIVWVGDNKPEIGAQISIEYVYDSLAREIEDWSKIEFHRYIEPRVFYRKALEVPIEVELQVKVFRGYGSEVLNQIASVLFDKINGLPLGVGVDVSDIVVWSYLHGVDKVVVTKLARRGEGGGVQDLQIGKSQYFVVDMSDIVITKI